MRTGFFRATNHVRANATHLYLALSLLPSAFNSRGTTLAHVGARDTHVDDDCRRFKAKIACRKSERQFYTFLRYAARATHRLRVVRVEELLLSN